MTTYQLLQMLPERREAGKGVEELLEEIGLDCAYVKKRFGRRQPSRPWRDTYIDPNDGYQAETIEEFRARCGTEYREWQTRDWMEWINPLKTTPLDDIYKRHYNDAAIADLVTRPHPLFAMLKKGDGWDKS